MLTHAERTHTLCNDNCSDNIQAHSNLFLPVALIKRQMKKECEPKTKKKKLFAPTFCCLEKVFPSYYLRYLQLILNVLFRLFANACDFNFL